MALLRVIKARNEAPGRDENVLIRALMKKLTSFTSEFAFLCTVHEWWATMIY
jgi:hypothetical protein